MKLGFTMAETQTASSSQFYTGFTTGTRLSGAAERGLGPVAVFDVEGDSVTGSQAVDLWNNAFRELFTAYNLAIGSRRYQEYASVFGSVGDLGDLSGLSIPSIILQIDRHDVAIKALFDLVKALAMRINDMERKPQNVMEEWMLATGGKR